MHLAETLSNLIRGEKSDQLTRWDTPPHHDHRSVGYENQLGYVDSLARGSCVSVFASCTLRQQSVGMA